MTRMDTYISRPDSAPKPATTSGSVDGGHSAAMGAISRVLGRAPASGLVIAGVCGLQAGAALTTRLYPAVGTGGGVTLRLCLAAVVLCSVWRPGLVRNRSTGQRWDRATIGIIVAAGTLLVVHHPRPFQDRHRVDVHIADLVEELRVTACRREMGNGTPI